MDQPNLSIRVHQKTPDSFLMQAVRDMKSGGGKPAVFNDEVIIPSLMSKSSVSLEEARNYATFVDLDQKMQDDIINRTEQEL